MLQMQLLIKQDAVETGEPFIAAIEKLCPWGLLSKEGLKVPLS